MASSHQHQSLVGKNQFENLPRELLTLIISQLSNRSVKSLRLTDKFFSEVAQLRINRVFLSANPRDVDVFRSVADHDTFRKRVTELIWDDAVITPPRPEEANDPRFPEEHPEDQYYVDEDDTEDCPGWFARQCAANNFFLKGQYQGDLLDRPRHAIEAQLPLSRCWEFYEEMRTQQLHVMQRGEDVAALRYGLSQFPRLRTITITPATHGFLQFPLYYTPTIRSFPSGLNYPQPRGWPTATRDHIIMEMPPWTDEQGGSEMKRNMWRGFRIVMKILQEQADEHHVSELIVDAHELQTGLSCRIFEQHCPEYDAFARLLRRPGFRHLNLDLSVVGQEFFDWPAFRGTHLRQALADAQDLEHFALSTDVALGCNWPHLDGLPPIAHHIPLHQFLPVDRWAKLRHFGLMGFQVTLEDLLSTISKLPETLRSLNLGDLYFFENMGSWRSLLEAMRDRLDWRNRPASARPQLSIRTRLMFDYRHDGRSYWIDPPVTGKFLYESGPNPFTADDPDFLGDEAPSLERDAFDAEFDRPNVPLDELMALGYVKKAPPWFSEEK